MHHVTASQRTTGTGAYSPAVVHSGLVFTSGQGPIDPQTGSIVGSTLEQQLNATFDNLEAVLAEAGATIADVIRFTVYLRHVERDFAEYDRLFRQRVLAPWPARTTIGCELNGILIEIDAVAAAPTRANGGQ